MSIPDTLSKDNAQSLDQLTHLLERQSDQKASMILKACYHLLHLDAHRAESMISLIQMCRKFTLGQMSSLQGILRLIPPKPTQ